MRPAVCCDGARRPPRVSTLLLLERKPDDSLLVALSGHGISRRVKVRAPGGGEQVKEAPFFCPIEADIHDPESFLSIDDFYARLEGSKAGVKVMLVDACRNDPTEGKAAAIEFHIEPPPPSVAALFACSNGEVAWDSGDLGGGHGVFFHYVVELLQRARLAWRCFRDASHLARLTSCQTNPRFVFRSAAAAPDAPPAGNRQRSPCSACQQRPQRPTRVASGLHRIA